MKKCYVSCICIMLFLVSTLNAAFIENDFDPECTILTAPEDGALDVFPDENLFWNPVVDATGYIVRMGTQSGATDFLDDVVTTDAFLNIPTMDNNTIYYVTIIPFSLTDVADGCIETTFQVGDQLSPECISLTFPESGATDVSIFTSFDWEFLENADGYFFSLGTTPYGRELVDNLDIGDVTSFSVNELEYNTTYYISVVPYGAFGEAVGCDEEFFTTENLPVPDCPTIETPNNNATDVAVNTTINWLSVENADGYTISVGTIPGGTDLINEENVLDATSINPGTLENETVYYVSILAYNELGFSQNCGTYSFTTAPLASEISITCPANQVVQAPIGLNSVTINWEAPSVATSCEDEELSLTQVAGLENGGVWPAGSTTTVQYDVTDNCGNINSCNFVVTIEENLLEYNVTCPANITLVADNPNGRVITLNEPLFTTNCGDENVTITQTNGPESGTLFPVGTSAVSYDITLVCNEETYTENCNFNVAIEPGELEFSVACPSDIVTLTNSLDGIAVAFGEPTYSTNCDPENITIAQTAGPSSSGIFPVGSTTVTYEVILVCNGQSYLESCSFEVNVELEEEECVEAIDGFKLLGQYENHNYFISESVATWTEASNIASMNGGALVSITDANENEFIRPLLENNIVFIGLFQNEDGTFGWDSEEPFSYDFIETPANVGDTFGNMNFWSGGWSFDSEYVERLFVMEISCGPTPPAMDVTCPLNQTIVAESLDSINVTWEDPLVSSTCPVGTILNLQVQGPISGSLFAVGTTTTISYEIADACNNVETCSFLITIDSPSTSGCVDVIDGLTLLGDFEGHKYFRSNEAASWLDAAEFAAEKGGYLVAINDANENEFIRQNISEIAFIGLNDFENEGDLVWDSGEPFDYTFLTSTNQVGADFASINFWDGSWQLENNQVNKPFIVEFNCEDAPPSLSVTCSENLVLEAAEGLTSVFITWEIPVGMTTCEDGAVTVVQTRGPAFGSILEVGENVNVGYQISDACGNMELCEFNIEVVAYEPDECPEFLENFTLLGEYDNHNYFLSNNAMGWLDAQAMAAELGGYLASITTPEENEFLRSNITEISLIGLSDEIEEGSFEWDSGETYLSGNILDGNTEGEDFGTINFWNGGWGTVDQYVQKPFIVELECQIFPQGGSGRIGRSEPVSIGKVFPNPTRELVSIDVNSVIETTTTIQVFDVLGVFQKSQIAKLGIGNNIISIDISDMKNGIHFIQLENEDALLLKKKFVKMQ